MAGQLTLRAALAVAVVVMTIMTTPSGGNVTPDPGACPQNYPTSAAYKDACGPNQDYKSCNSRQASSSCPCEYTVHILG